MDNRRRKGSNQGKTFSKKTEIFAHISVALSAIGRFILDAITFFNQ